VLIYFSGGGVTGVWERVNRLLIERQGARLLSFAYPRLLLQYCELVQQMAQCGDIEHVPKVMVDSGAFSAWTKGGEVDVEQLSSLFKGLLDDYSECCQFVLINLDVIPGRKGVDPTPQQLIDAMRRSEDNFHLLNTRFPNLVLPVFHQGEPSHYYDKLVRESSYVCLSPRNDLPEKYRVDWSRQYCRRYPNKYHGLAATGLTMMETVNWYSVDSAAWVMVGGYGNIFYRTKTKLSVLSVSSQSKARKDFDSHIETLSAPEKAAVLDAIAQRHYTLEALQNDDTERYMWNADCWLDLSLSTRETAHLGGLFDE
jgi:hypothetical protein